MHQPNIIEKKPEKILKSLVKGIKNFLKKKNKKREYGHEQDKNISEDEKQKLVEYRKRYYEMQKNLKCSIRFQFLAIRVKMG